MNLSFKVTFLLFIDELFIYLNSGNNYHHNDTYSQPSESNGIDGSTPISQIGASPNNQVSLSFIQSLSLLSHFLLFFFFFLSYNLHLQFLQGVSRLCNSHPYPPEESGPVRKTKRGVLPKQATEILRSWLFSHIVVSITLLLVHVTS